MKESRLCKTFVDFISRELDLTFIQFTKISSIQHLRVPVGTPPTENPFTIKRHNVVTEEIILYLYKTYTMSV